MTLDEWKESKKSLGYTEEQMAKLTGISIEKINAIFYENKIPDFETFIILEDVLQQPCDMIGEEKTPYIMKKKERYTLEDYYAIPDGMRVELIDGVIYDSSAPTVIHQMLVGEIWLSLKNYVDKNKGECMPVMSPLDVQLNCDNHTMVQPDVLVVCDKEKIINRCIYGAPDFIVEILSTSTAKKDKTIKLAKYREAGVREYWMVDSIKKKVIVYNFIQNEHMIYGFEDKVPVAIFENQCEVDFAEIYQRIQFLYDTDS